MRIKFLAFFLIFIILASATAQDEVPLPVLNAEDIFAEGVTVLERLPVIARDDEQRKLHYFNLESETWQSYDYPQDLEWITHFSQTPYADGTYLLSPYVLLFPQLVRIDNVWLFESVTGEIFHPDESQEVCDVIPVYNIPYANSEKWIVDEENQVLCNIESGETAPLPTDDTWAGTYQRDFVGPVLTTTSNEHFVVLGNYVYDIMMGKWRYLGDVKLLTSDNDRDVFLNNHLIIIIAHGASITGKYGPYAATSNLLIADARYENSMVHVNELPHDYHRKTSYDFNGENLFVWGDIWQERLVFIEYNLDTKQLKLLYSGGRPVTNPYQAGYELPNNVYLHPSIPNILGFENTDGFHLLNLETEEVIATGEQFERWIGENRLLVWQGNEFIYDYVISPDNDGVSGLDWPTPEIRVEPSIISIDEKFMLVSAFGEFDNLSPLWLVDLGTRERLSGEIIINKPDNTLVTWIWQDDNTGIVEFYQDDHHRKTIARWHIHIDALNEGQS